jgi:hypothetical protein
MNKLGLARDIYRVKLSALRTYTAPNHEEANAPAVASAASAAIAVAASESKLVSA